MVKNSSKTSDKRQNHNESPLVSVIIPTYNRAGLLSEAINSVVNQDYGTFELIVVDDGSSDETGRILDTYGSGIRVIFQPNRGVSAARNAGIRRSKGRYIAFLDSDDLWLPGKLSAQAAFFASNTKAKACQTEELWIRRGIRVNPRKYHHKSVDNLFLKSLERCLVSPSAVMIRRSLFDEVGFFDESLPACEDYDLWLRVSCRYPVYLIEKPFVVKRGGHADQLSRNPGLDRYRIRALVKIIETGSLTRIQKSAALDVLEKKCAIYADGCLKRGRREEYCRFLELSRQFSTAKAD